MSVFWKRRRKTAAAAIVWVSALGLSGCGGGEPAPEATPGATPAARSPAAPTPSAEPPATPTAKALSLGSAVSAVQTVSGQVSPAEAARQLKNFAEQTFPTLFPGHPPTQPFGPYLFRFYPETGNYLAVAGGQVYVSGPMFGVDLLNVGPLLSFITPVPGPTASVTTPSTAKTPWRLATPARFELRDASGVLVPGPLSCTSEAPMALAVAADCSSITGLRLGWQPVRVRSGTQAATVSIKVVPVTQPLGMRGAATAVPMVVTPDGRVLAWGSNSQGLLGQGQPPAGLPSTGLPLAVKDASGSGLLRGIVAVSAGARAALALTEDGEVFSWGNNSNGELGRTLEGPNVTLAPLPGKVLSPTGTGTLKGIVAVSMGDGNAVALADDGSVYTWGGWTGQDGSTGMRRFPGIPVGLDGRSGFGQAVAISAGSAWSLALLADGRVVSWGFSSNGNLGRPANAIHIPGVVVLASSGAPLTDIAAISAGYQHALALDRTGRAWAWGRGANGQLGGGANTTSPSFATPVKSPDGGGTLDDVAMLVAGGNHSLALDRSGRAFSWGFATSGQLGDGANRLAGNGRNLPAPVVDLTGTLILDTVVTLVAGYDGSAALLRDGRVVVWGNGASGALGQGNTLSALSPVPLPVKNEAGSADLLLTPMSSWTGLPVQVR